MKVNELDIALVISRCRSSHISPCNFLIERNRPLVSGYFEAWEYGPVHPTAYQAFKTAGSQPISFRARRLDAATGARMDILPPNDVEITRHAARIMQSYGSMMPGRLVD